MHNLVQVELVLMMMITLCVKTRPMSQRKRRTAVKNITRMIVEYGRIRMRKKCKRKKGVLRRLRSEQQINTRLSIRAVNSSALQIATHGSLEPHWKPRGMTGACPNFAVDSTLRKISCTSTHPVATRCCRHNAQVSIGGGKHVGSQLTVFYRNAQQ